MLLHATDKTAPSRPIMIRRTRSGGRRHGESHGRSNRARSASSDSSVSLSESRRWPSGTGPVSRLRRSADLLDARYWRSATVSVRSVMEVRPQAAANGSRGRRPDGWKTPISEGEVSAEQRAATRRRAVRATHRLSMRMRAATVRETFRHPHATPFLVDTGQRTARSPVVAMARRRVSSRRPSATGTSALVDATSRGSRARRASAGMPMSDRRLLKCMRIAYNLGV